ncbi:hypothetical protein [Paraburkholderia sp. RAU6.4a]|uniref:hypothetical protein n=1 Tax=Paraburkholderia sp. RAU6.4a TaxID=2991067 RepID=UPI003D1FBC92
MRKASVQQLWVSRQVGDLIAAVSNGEKFNLEKLCDGVERIIRHRWRVTNQAARSLGLAFNTVSSASTGKASVGLRLLLSLCSSVDIGLVDLLRGKRATLKNCEPIIFPRYFTTQKQLRDGSVLRREVNGILKSEPDIRIGQLADRIGVKSCVLYRKLPDVVQQLRANRLKRMSLERWRVHLRFARKLRTAKRQLEDAGRQLTTVSLFQCVKVIPRCEEEIRLYHFVRDRLA